MMRGAGVGILPGRFRITKKQSYQRNICIAYKRGSALVPANPAGDTWMGACSRNRSYCSGITLRDAVQ
jgi:hypothetical protein